MYPRSLWATGDVCLRCEWRLLSQRHKTRQIHSRIALSSRKAPRVPQRTLHAAAIRSQLASTPAPTSQSSNPELIPHPQHLPIRQHLVQWQQQFSSPTEEILSAFQNHPACGDMQNGISKLSSGYKADEDSETNEWDGGEGDEGEELITIGLFLRPGDVVELSQPGREPVLAVFVQQINNISQFFSVNGRWSHSILAKVAFAITGCFDPSLLQPLVPFLPTDPVTANPKGEVHVPIDIAAPVQATLQRMTEDAERIYRKNASVLDTAYAVLADPARTRMMTLTQITKTLLGRDDPAWVPSPASLLAVRKALNHNEFRFRSDIRSHRLTNVFAIRPKNDVQVVETVHEWIREYHDHLALSANKSLHSVRKCTKGASYVAEFLEKTRRLVANSRKDRAPNRGNLGPSKTRLTATDGSSKLQVVWGEPFTSTDKQIINFLQAWVLTGQFNGMGGLHAACASLILATDCYGAGVVQNPAGFKQVANEMRRAMGFVFLQEIGVLLPYENRAIYDEQLMLPTVRLSRNLELLNTKAELTRRNPDFRDSMADLRRDWGSTTVYCIDDVGAQEIDDGISIERVKGQDSEFWIHVHVANPTAFFDKTHTLSGLAAHMTQTVYTPERTFPMLPTWATQGYFSLDRNRPVITFSSKINRNGSVLETKIQHGIIRKVISLTPSELSSLLGENFTTETRKLVVGGEIPVEGKDRPLPNLSPNQLEDLNDLYSAAKALWEMRKAAGAIRFANVSPNVRVFENPSKAGLTWDPPSIDRARLVQGDPIIELTNTISTGLIQYSMSPKNIVEEMMILAGQTAASWCTERHIPVMYRGTVEPPTGDSLSSEKIKQSVMSYWEKQEEPPLKLAILYTGSLSRAIAHSEPLPHKIIGVSGYVKVTSPLRRFSDMIAHWQIEGAIRHEARSGKKFNATNPTNASRGVLPFSQRQMQESIVTLSPRERIISETHRASTRFWTVMAMMRAFHYKEAPLPDIFMFWVRTVPDVGVRTTVSGYLPEYGLRAKMIDHEAGQVGDQWEVKLDSFDVFDGDVYVKPVRLVSREASFP
ncbi:RNB-domain-containing protein [Cucurbitaria berberidis CBS 394.84]|uniref:RNB-domain-containing protein n=1 Tax=Cucurbitaria berberidis CBS 394.84 TaxID=1168544 RepID=A0A9P4GJJ9_9PLEO|nr:RNB-domain-containing protein [Cucurbitaria berberidis CBS 394.84]KAF1846326.1 RNB-domain-containing protein [Cucurbitaria berberidis CBS 394.84]